MLGSALLINTGPIGLGVNPVLIVGGALASLGLFGFVLRKAIAARSRPAYMGADSLIGAIGKVQKPLAPQGMVFVAGAVWRATAVEGRVPTGSEVRVVARQGLELIVVPLEAPAPALVAE
jgi:membrane-bound serine protease (ClpP class)